MAEAATAILIVAADKPNLWKDEFHESPFS